MALEENQVEGIDAAVSWDGIDPEDWREMVDPDGVVGNEDDDEMEWPDWMEGVLGFDPSTIEWEEESQTKSQYKHLSGQHNQSTHGRGGGGGASLAHPLVLLGGGVSGVSDKTVSDYLEANGKEWEASELPDGIERGEKKECYKNASQLTINNSELDYVEGIAYTDKLGLELGFLHAWAATKDGKVVDNTWGEPEKCTYFGVKYDKAKYLSHLAKTGVYGVLGGEVKTAKRVLKGDRI